MNFLNYMLETAPAADAANTGETVSGMGGMSMILIYVALFAALYFFMIRPQKKQEKQTNAMRNSLEVGDEVTTIGGIIGRVTHIKDDVVTIETGADRNKIRFKKSAIASIDNKKAEAKAPAGGYKVKAKKAEDKPEIKD